MGYKPPPEIIRASTSHDPILTRYGSELVLVGRLDEGSEFNIEKNRYEKFTLVFSLAILTKTQSGKIVRTLVRVKSYKPETIDWLDQLEDRKIFLTVRGDIQSSGDDAIIRANVIGEADSSLLDERATRKLTKSEREQLEWTWYRNSVEVKGQVQLLDKPAHRSGNDIWADFILWFESKSGNGTCSMHSIEARAFGNEQVEMLESFRHRPDRFAFVEGFLESARDGRLFIRTKRLGPCVSLNSMHMATKTERLSPQQEKVRDKALSLIPAISNPISNIAHMIVDANADLDIGEQEEGETGLMIDIESTVEQNGTIDLLAAVHRDARENKGALRTSRDDIEIIHHDNAPDTTVRDRINEARRSKPMSEATETSRSETRTRMMPPDEKRENKFARHMDGDDNEIIRRVSSNMASATNFSGRAASIASRAMAEAIPDDDPDTRRDSALVLERQRRAREEEEALRRMYTPEIERELRASSKALTTLINPDLDTRREQNKPEIPPEEKYRHRPQLGSKRR